MIDTRFALMLSGIGGIGPAKYKNLIKHFSDYDQLKNNGNFDLFRECGLTDTLVNKLMNFDDWRKIDRLIEKNQTRKY